MLTGDLNVTLGYTVTAGIYFKVQYTGLPFLSQPCRADVKYVYWWILYALQYAVHEQYFNTKDKLLLLYTVGFCSPYKSW